MTVVRSQSHRIRRTDSFASRTGVSVPGIVRSAPSPASNLARSTVTVTCGAMPWCDPAALSSRSPVTRSPNATASRCRCFSPAMRRPVNVSGSISGASCSSSASSPVRRIPSTRWVSTVINAAAFSWVSHAVSFDIDPTCSTVRDWSSNASIAARVAPSGSVMSLRWLIARRTSSTVPTSPSGISVSTAALRASSRSSYGSPLRLIADPHTDGDLADRVAS